MPFHVEISSPVNRVRVLDLDQANLRSEVLGPWVAGLSFEFGDGEWAPRESRLTILEGPALGAAAGADGWGDALRAAEDVTRQMLEAAEASAPAQTAVVIEADSVEAALEALRAGRPTQQIPWSSAAERIGKRDPEVTAVILVVKPADMAWPRS
ncbi:MAG: hypothetical protein WA862_13055 [Solirubrobacterales bacterium]